MPTDPNLSDPVVPFRLGGQVALDFVNTVSSWTKSVSNDYLGSFAKLVAWTQQSGLIDDENARGLLNRTSAKRSALSLHEVVELRGIVRRILVAIIDDTPPAGNDLKSLNAILKEARAEQTLTCASGTFGWELRASVDPRSLILTIALAAADFLEHADFARLKRCPPPIGCGWLFLDESRNRSRKWCSMEYCGGTAKARRFAETHRQPR